MPYLTIAGTTVHYAEKGAGIPFVFQHGMGGDLHQPQGFFAPPLPFRLISFDFRGHGQTQPIGNPDNISFNGFADDLAAFLDHLTLAQAVIGGISMGAGVALNFALRYPHRVRALILVRPAWLTEPDMPHQTVYSVIADLIREHGVARGEAIFRQSLAYRKYASHAPQVLPALLGQFSRPQAEAGSLILARMPHDVPNRQREDWQGLRIPSLVVATADDPIHPLEYGQTLAENIPGALFAQITPRYLDPERHAADLDTVVRTFLAKQSENET